MRTFRIVTAATVAGFAIMAGGCNRGETRANAERNRAASPEEGGGTLTTGSAGERQNFGDTSAKQKQDQTTPSASPTGQSKDAKAGQTGGTVIPPDTKAGTK